MYSIFCFECPDKPLNFPPCCPDYPWCNQERELVYLLKSWRVAFRWLIKVVTYENLLAYTTRRIKCGKFLPLENDRASIYTIKWIWFISLSHKNYSCRRGLNVILGDLEKEIVFSTAERSRFATCATKYFKSIFSHPRQSDGWSSIG